MNFRERRDFAWTRIAGGLVLASAIATGCTGEFGGNSSGSRTLVSNEPDSVEVSTVADIADSAVTVTATDGDGEGIRGSELGPIAANDGAGSVGETQLDKARRENAKNQKYDAEIAKKDEEAIEKALANVKTESGVVPITFKMISSYEYEEPKPGKPETLKKGQVPPEVKALDGKKVTMIGYMVPLDLTADHKVKLFFLASNTQACCFGQYPSIHEVVEVRVKDGTHYHKDEPVMLTGTFEVGEDFDEYGYLLSLYRIEAASVKAAWDK